MNKLLIILLFNFLLLSCTNKLASINSISKSNNILLKANKYSRFIFLKNDTAFYERFQPEKPSYFTDTDTLIYNIQENCYNGKVAFLKIDSLGFILKYSKGRDIGKQIIFLEANEKEIEKWTIYKLHYKAVK